MHTGGSLLPNMVALPPQSELLADIQTHAKRPAARVYRNAAHSGFTLLELIVALAIFSVISGMAIANLKLLNRPLQNASAQTVSFLKLIRGRAISNTLALRVTPTSALMLGVSSAETCSSATWTPQPTLQFNLPLGAHFTDTTWSVCFTTRGLVDVNYVIGLRNDGGDIKNVEVLLGGGVRLL